MAARFLTEIVTLASNTHDTHVRNRAAINRLHFLELKPVQYTVAEKCDSRRISPFSATVALFCDSVDRAF